MRSALELVGSDLRDYNYKAYHDDMSENWPSFKPGKLDLLFHISHLLDLRTGGRSLPASAIYSRQAYAALRPLNVGASLLGCMAIELRRQVSRERALMRYLFAWP